MSEPLHIPELEIPPKEKFKGFLREEDIEDLTNRDRKTILRFSSLEQINDWQDDGLRKAYIFMRWLEQNQINDRIAMDKWRAENEKMRVDQMKSEWYWSLAKWLIAIITAGVVTGFFRWLFGK